MSAPYYALAGLCVAGSVVTHIFAPEGPIALTLAIAGSGALGKLALDKNREAAAERERAEREKRRGDQLFEETQTLKSRH